MKPSIVLNFTKIDATGTFYKEFNVKLKWGSKFNVYSEGKLIVSLLAEESRFFGKLSSGEIVTYKPKFQFFSKQSLYYIKDGSLFCRIKNKSFFSRIKEIEFATDQSKYFLRYYFKRKKLIEIQKDFEAEILNQFGETVARIISDKNLPAYQNNPNCEAAGTIELSKDISPDKLIGFLSALIIKITEDERGD